VDHSGLHIFTPQQFLDGADIVSGFQQVGGKGVAKGVRADGFDYAGSLSGQFGALRHRPPTGLQSLFARAVDLREKLAYTEIGSRALSGRHCTSLCAFGKRLASGSLYGRDSV